MNNLRVIRALIFSAIFVIGFTHHVLAETSNRVVAIVNDEVITLHELKKKMEEMTGQTMYDIRSQDKEKYLDTRQKILDVLINERLTQEKIQELGISVSQGEVDSTIERIKKSNQLTHEELMATLKNEGITYEKYREVIKKDLERRRLISYEVSSKIIIREEQIVQYYQENKGKYTRAARVHLAGIFLKKKNPNDKDEISELTRKGKDLLDRIRKGEDFGELAREFSEGPGADEGGDLGIFKTVQLDPELRKILEGIPEGGVSDPIIRRDGVQIIKLFKREEAKEKSFEEVRDLIFEILYKEEINKRYASWIKELRENTYTKIIF